MNSYAIDVARKTTCPNGHENGALSWAPKVPLNCQFAPCGLALDWSPTRGLRKGNTMPKTDSVEHTLAMLERVFEGAKRLTPEQIEAMRNDARAAVDAAWDAGEIEWAEDGALVVAR